MTMIRIPVDQPIDFLVARKFPRPTNSAVARGGRGFQGDWTEEQHLLYAEIKKYRAELASKSAEEITQLYQAALLQDREAKEKERFFNQPYALADFEHWSKATYWTLDEAISLSFGKNPSVVNKQTMAEKSRQDAYFHLSPFVLEYHKLTDLAERAKNGGQLYDPVLPGFFMAWAKKNDIILPPELEQLVVKRSGNLVDWKKQYDDLLASYNEKLGTTSQLISAMEQRLEAEKNKSAALETLVTSLKSKPQEPKPQQKPLHTKEKETLLKMIIGMAVGGYGFDPTAVKSTIPTDIYNDLALRGVRLDPDTIRNKLKEAAQLLSGAEVEKPNSVVPKPNSAKTR